MKLWRIDKDRWKERLRDPFWQFAGFVAAILAIVASVFVAYDIAQVPETGTDLVVTLYGKYPLVWYDPEFESDLEIYYRGAKVQDVSAMIFSLRNAGKNAIRPDDYVSPICLSVEQPSELGDVRIYHTHPENVDLSIASVTTNTTELSQSLLNPGDTVVFAATLVGDPDPYSEPKLKAAGRVVGVKEIVIEPSEPGVLDFTTTGFSFSFWEASFAAALGALLFLVSLFLVRRTTDVLWTSALIEVRIMFLAAGAAVTAAWALAFALALLEPHKPTYWDLWWPPTVGGALVAVAYILYLLFQLRKLVLKRKKEE